MSNITKDILVKYNNNIIYDPIKVASSSGDENEAPVNGYVDFQISNVGDRAYDDVGVYIRPASSMGDIDSPATMPPETDYQDLLTWGERANADANNIQGGVTITCITRVDPGVRVSKANGNAWSNRILLGTMEPGVTLGVKAEFQIPTDVQARRLFVAIVVG